METLYHYCTSEAFFSIASTHSIWLSSLNLSNDTMEGRNVANAVMRLAERDKVSGAERERLRYGLAFTERSRHGLAFCLSEERDLLSQWRGYADDGRGVSIGFSPSGLAWMMRSWIGGARSLDLYGVVYEGSEHEKLVEPTYRKLLDAVRRGAFAEGGMLGSAENLTAEDVLKANAKLSEDYPDVLASLLNLSVSLYRLKGHAFREEAEYRLVSVMLNDAAECEFRAKGARLIPYRKIGLTARREPCIVEVVLGPRHQTPVPVVKTFLKSCGLGDASVTVSEATYR